MEEEKEELAQNTDNVQDSATQTSARDRFAERIRSRHGDDAVADDDALFTRALADYDDYAAMSEREGKLKSMIDADPRAASVLVDLADGKDALLGLIRRFGPELKAILDDPEEQERLAAEMDAYLDKVSQDRRYEEEYTQNLRKSMALADEIQAEKGWTSEQMDEIVSAIVGIGRATLMGEFPRETFIMVAKALNYDNDVALAREEGEVAGRNAKIDEGRLELRRPTDGLPALSGATPDTPDESASDNIFALAAQAR